MKKILGTIFITFLSLHVNAQIGNPSRGIDDNGFGNQFGDTDARNLRDTTGVKGGLRNGKLLDDSTRQIYGPRTA